ncbi:MAG TPA: transcription-repair coupling factor [candidate division Zixibacteria bacterium]|nr:transcription-repair coupling factor [candidate division Zixibacteria bacterium]
MIQKILQIIENSGSYQKALEISNSGQKDLEVSGLVGAGRSFFLYNWFSRFPGKYLVITKTEKEAFSIKNDLNEISGNGLAFQFPAWNINPYQWKTPATENIGERLQTLYNLQNRQNIIVTASVRAILEPTISPDELSISSLHMEINQEMAQEDLISRLAELGYERDPMVEEIGSFSVRGGIVDIFPYTTENPIRIEFFGDFIESIRSFSVANQRSIATVDRMTLLPRRESLLTIAELDKYMEKLPERDQEILSDKFRFGIDTPGLEWATAFFNGKRSYLFDYIDSNANLYLLEPGLLRSECDDLTDMFENCHEQEREKYEELPKPDRIYLQPEEFESRLEGHKRISEISFGKSPGAINFGMNEHPVINSQIKLLKNNVKSLHERHYSVHLACDNKVQKDRMRDILEEDADWINTSVLDISEGFIFPQSNLAVLTDHQIFTRKFHRYRKARIKEGVAISSYTNLNIGDYVVHVDYGIGRYRGLEELTIENRRRDCLLIMYHKDDKLYVPIEEFNRVQKYIGKEGRPKLSTLRGTAWQKAKARTKKAITEMAEELLRLYAKRRARPGFKFSPDSTWIRQLEASFPFDETPDQLDAIADIKEDMETGNPMDRLICGDVGYGKTEVAIRAAFKAVCDDKQVAVLVPTTILAQQHQTTFRNRLADFPVRIEMLSRFKSRKEQREIIKDLAEGKVDIVIGTHRLLSKDVNFRDLGLLVVDEEQRFGVAHKEKIKKMKSQVDVLTMTATPIPRTMQMSLLGARDMSVINTSPKDRLPIDTEISEFHPEAIRKEILGEVERGGQVYFVHNRVQTIMSIYRYLSRLLPHIRIAVAHGQMPEKELEEIMLSFLSQHYDVLLSTSIIESGLDIPMVNTIIINRADHFGLAQLYQLRGRVGRSSRRARALLLIPPLRLLTTTARKRLKALEQHTELGSGFQLAMKDLEIRGAGNMLGPQQHGFIEEVGFDLYLKLLKEAVAELKGEKTEERTEVKMDIDLEMYFPDDYIPFSQQKVELYQRLAQAEDYKEINDLRLEVIDRFGQMPPEAENLFEMAELKLLASRLKLSRLAFRKNTLKIVYSNGYLPSKKQIANLSSRLSEPIEFSASGEFTIAIDYSQHEDSDWGQKFKFSLQLLA